MCICILYIYIYIYILKFEITPKTTSKLLVDWMFIDDICEHDRLVSAFDCLLPDIYTYIHTYIHTYIYVGAYLSCSLFSGGGGSTWRLIYIFTV